MKVDKAMVLKALLTWVDEGVLKEEDENSENAHRGQEQANKTPRLSLDCEVVKSAPVSSAGGPEATTDHDMLSVGCRWLHRYLILVHMHHGRSHRHERQITTWRTTIPVRPGRS